MERVVGRAPAPPVEPGHQLDPALGGGAATRSTPAGMSYRGSRDWVRDAPAANPSADRSNLDHRIAMHSPCERTVQLRPTLHSNPGSVPADVAQRPVRGDPIAH